MFKLLSYKQTPLISGLIAITTFALITYFDHLITKTSNHGILSHQLCYSKDMALHILNGWGASGRSLFLKIIWLDYLFPIAYAFFLSSLLIKLTSHIKNANNELICAVLILLPFIMAFFDMVENTYQIVQVTDMASLPSWFFFMTAITSIFKWLTTFIIILAITILFLKYKFKRQAV